MQEAEILAYTMFHMAAILKIQYGCHSASGEHGSYKKSKSWTILRTYKKFGAFVRHVHIILITCLTISRKNENIFTDLIK